MPAAFLLPALVAATPTLGRAVATPPAPLAAAACPWSLAGAGAPPVDRASAEGRKPSSSQGTPRRAWLAGVSRRVWVPPAESSVVEAGTEQRITRRGHYRWIDEAARHDDEIEPTGAGTDPVTHRAAGSRGANERG